MLHPRYRHSPKRIQSRLKKVFPELYGLYPKTLDMAPAIEGYIAMFESNWAPKDWLDVDQTKTSWAWMLSVRNVDRILESGVSKGSLEIRSEDMALECGAPEGDMESHNGSGDYLNSGDDLGGSEVVVDLNGIRYEPNYELFEEGERPERIEIHLDQSVDFLILSDANQYLD